MSKKLQSFMTPQHKAIQTLLGNGIVAALSAHQPTLQKLLTPNAAQQPSQEDAKCAMKAQMKRLRKQQRNLKGAK